MDTIRLNSISSPVDSNAAIRSFSEGEALSQMMTTLLERRYLDEFSSEFWQIFPPDSTVSVPLLRQIQAVGRHNNLEEVSRNMTQALTACHQPGHALITVLIGQGGQQQLFWGTKRIVGQATGSTADYAAGLSGHLQSVDRELQLGDAVRLDDDSLVHLNTFLQQAPACMAITGIPSARSGQWNLHKRGLDRIAQVMGMGKAAFFTVAEPVPGADIDHIIDACLRLKSDIQEFVQSTWQSSQTHGQNKSFSEQRSNTNEINSTPALLMDAAYFIQALGRLSPTAPFTNAVAGLMIGTSGFMVRRTRQTQTANREAQFSVSESETSGESRTLFNAHAEACVQLIDKYIQRFRATRNYGCWNTVTYILAESEALLATLSGTLRSLASGDNTHMDPMREIRMSTSQLRAAIQTGSVLSLILDQGERNHPLGTLYDRLGTCISSDELAMLMPLPFNPLPGIVARLPLRFALTAPLVNTESLRFGRLQDGLTASVSDLSIPLDSLGTHAFIAGKSGSGKTNTCMQVLSEAYVRHRIPFMVIEPAKAEYRNLMQLSALQGHLRVFAVGNPKAPALRLNPFEPVPGIAVTRHIDLLKSVFNASFPMFAGMSYVLEESLYEIYQERGWSLYDSSNRYLSERPSVSHRAVLLPTLPDLLQKIEVVLKRKNYGQEIHQNLGAALRSRIQSLLIGTKGVVFNTRSSIPIEELMDHPCVIELQYVGNDEEKAFLSALLYILVYEYAEVRQRRQPFHRREQLQHILLIEEAHQLLGARSQSGSEEVGDPKGKAVALFTDMLAELRSYGEGIMIADQTPTKLTRDVIKNTNLKIIHRLTDPDERQAAGRSMSLSEEQINSLISLPDGFAVIQDKHYSEPLLTKVFPFKHQHLTTLTQLEEEAYLQSALPVEKQYLYRNGGCEHCSCPCLMYVKIVEDDRIKPYKALEFTLLNIVQRNDHDSIYLEHWLPWVENQQKEVAASQANEYLYCMAIQQAEAWLTERLTQKQVNRNQSMQSESTETNPLLTPTARLTKDKILESMGIIFSAWLFEPDDNTRRRLFSEAQKVMPAW